MAKDEQSSGVGGRGAGSRDRGGKKGGGSHCPPAKAANKGGGQPQKIGATSKRGPGGAGSRDRGGSARTGTDTIGGSYRGADR